MCAPGLDDEPHSRRQTLALPAGCTAHVDKRSATCAGNCPDGRHVHRPAGAVATAHFGVGVDVTAGAGGTVTSEDWTRKARVNGTATKQEAPLKHIKA